MKAPYLLVVVVLAVGIASTPVRAGESLRALTEQPFRPPAVPLFVVDPYLSVWSAADKLTDSPTTHWTGFVRQMTGMLSVDGQAFRFMGEHCDTVPALPQISVQVNHMQTVYKFAGAGVAVKVTFTTPSFLDNIELLALPGAYMDIEVTATDDKDHSVKVYFDATGEGVTSATGHKVIWSRSDSASAMTARIGSSDQTLLTSTNDNIDWGFLYLSTPGGDGVSVSGGSAKNMRDAFAAGKPLPLMSTENMPRAVNASLPAQMPAIAISKDLGKATSMTFTAVVSYDEVFSMKYFGDYVVPYWKKLYDYSITRAIDAMLNGHDDIVRKCADFDIKNGGDMVRIGGSDYGTVTSLAYRQATGATKLVWNERKGEMMYFLKEISSDGDVSTVDVFYPAAPVFLYHNPEMLRLIMMPLMQYANNETFIQYNRDYAPHHLGVWPICDLPADQQEDMPVEESANMLLLFAAIAQRQKNDVSYLKPYWPLLEKWAGFLFANLPYPGDQLTTDDFAGRSTNNTNLAGKGIVGLGAWSLLQSYAGDTAGATKTRKIADALVTVWTKEYKSSSGDHWKFDLSEDNSFSQKYNLVWDKTLKLNMFPDEVFDLESKYMIKVSSKYGFPLDSRRTYTKGDWMSWVAAFSSDDISSRIFSFLVQFANDTPNRVPFSDWFETATAQQSGFQARPVYGALWMKALLESEK